MFLKSKRQLCTCVLEYFHFKRLHKRCSVRLKPARVGRIHGWQWRGRTPPPNTPRSHLERRHLHLHRGLPLTPAQVHNVPGSHATHVWSVALLTEEGVPARRQLLCKSFLLNSHTGPSVSADVEAARSWERHRYGRS